ncbi:MAG: thioredoxin family protein [Bacteroidia bacterium]|nr:thioredoxin family protein [Bacteroidia bacterium]
MKFDHEIPNSFTYQEYLDLIDGLLEVGKTTGEKQTETLLDFTTLNRRRMKRLDKTVQVNGELREKISKIKGKQRWIVLTEAWCGDAAQNLPLLAKMASENENIELRLILRDENPDIMNDFLTNGGKSIPKLIAIDEASEVVFTWGPRPEPAQHLLREYKANPNGRSYEEFNIELHTWYARDKTVSAQEELVRLL